jgi:hypothetical protein
MRLFSWEEAASSRRWKPEARTTQRESGVEPPHSKESPQAVISIAEEGEGAEVAEGLN